MHGLTTGSYHYHSQCTVLHDHSSGLSNINISIPIVLVDSVTDIGVTYCNRVTFSKHVDKIVRKESLRAKH